MKILLAGFIVISIVLLFLEVPILFNRGVSEVSQAIEDTETIELRGKTLFISDLHLRYDPLNGYTRLSGPGIEDVNNVVIVGDFFHNPSHFTQFGGTEQLRFQNVVSQVFPDDFSGSIYFIYGEGHDPMLEPETTYMYSGYTFTYLGEYGKFEVNETPVVAFHGHQLHGGAAGGFISWVAQKLGYPTPLEQLGKNRFQIPRHSWVVTGHSHVPALYEPMRTINLGSFVGAPVNFIFNLPAGTGFLFHNGEIERVEFQPINRTNLYFL